MDYFTGTGYQILEEEYYRQMIKNEGVFDWRLCQGCEAKSEDFCLHYCGESLDKVKFDITG